MPAKKVKVGFCAGNTMKYLAEDYSTIPEVVDEFVQNLLDAKATEAIIMINLKSRAIEAFDNGKGASEAEFTRKVQKISKSEKGEGDTGGKGIGNLASIGVMGKGGVYQLTTRQKSRSRATSPYFTASLKYDHLDNADEVSFTFEQHGSSHTFQGFRTVDGRDVSAMTTRVRTTCIEPTALTTITKSPDALRDLCEEIGGSYAAKIKNLNAKITIAIIGDKDSWMLVEPQEFKGRREDPVLIETKSGIVKFEMFTTTSQEKKPIIRVRHKGVYDMDLRNMKAVWGDYKDVFGSGYIQGCIHLNFCETDTKRENFVWGDELQDFMEAIEVFVQDYAKKWLKELAKHQRIHRIQQSIENAMAAVDKFLKDNPDMLSESLRGAISDGHQPKDGAKKNVKLLGPRRKKTKNNPPISSIPRMTGEKPNMKHVSGQDDKGKKRTIVKGESGFTVLHVEPDPLTEDINWTYKIDEGIVLVNINHKLFKVHSDKSKASLDTYVLELMRAALSEAKIRDERGDIGAHGFRSLFESFHVHHVDIMIK